MVSSVTTKSIRKIICEGSGVPRSVLEYSYVVHFCKELLKSMFVSTNHMPVLTHVHNVVESSRGVGEES
jgi:hypothetical protein